MTLHRLLKLLRIFYQGLRLITSGIKTEIDEIEKEIQAEEGQQQNTQSVS